MSGSSVGSVVGFFVGNAIAPGLGGAIGSLLGGAIGNEIAPQVVKGPSLGDAQQQTSQPGVPRPIIFGHPAPFAGNLIDGEKKARKIIKEQQQGKGGGPVVKEEHFILTYAIRMGEPIGGLLRAWRQGKVVYDARPLEAMPGWNNPATAEAVAEYFGEMQAANQKFLAGTRIYLGGEEQLPDPALEMLHGVGNTPYHRGTSYMVREDDDVTDCGGAAPRWMFECISCAIARPAPLRFFGKGSLPGTLKVSADGKTFTQRTYPELAGVSVRFVAANGSNVVLNTQDGRFWYSTDSGESFQLSPSTGNAGYQELVYGNGRWVCFGETCSVSTDGGATWVNGSPVGFSAANYLTFGKGVFVATGGNAGGGVYWSATGLHWTIGTYVSTGLPLVSGAMAGCGFNGDVFMSASGPNPYVSDDGKTWAYCGVTPDINYIWAFIGHVGYMVAVTSGGGLWRTTNRGASWTQVLATGNNFYGGISTPNLLIASQAGGGSPGDYWSDDDGLSWAAVSGVGQVIQYGYTGITQGAVAIPDAPGSYVDPVTGQVSVPTASDLLEFCADLTLQQVEEAIAARAGVPAGRFDASALSEILIPGYLVARQATGAECLRPLCQAYFHDLPEPDGIYAVLRGAAPLEEITDDQLLLESNDPLITGQSLEYPLKVTVVTQHPEADYAAIPQTSERYSPDIKAGGEFTLTVPVPLSADETMAIAVKLHNVLWSRAEGSEELALPRTHLHLIPSDPIYRNGRRWLVETSNRAERKNKLLVYYDRESSYHTVTKGYTPQPPTPPGSGLIGPTVLEFLNLPMLSDSQDKVGFYVAAKGLFSAWDGAVLQGSIDSGATWIELADINAASVIGALETDLPDASEAVVDMTNTIRVNVGRGELDSITFDQLLMERNACVIGDEICQFQTATVVSPGIYDLTVLARGRLNTEAALHVSGERFVLLNAPIFVEVPTSWIGREILLRAVSNGTVQDDNASEAETWDPALIQTEWSPASFVGTRDGSNNVAISWTGRARMGSNDDPLHSSNFLGYRVQITKGATTVEKAITSNQYFSYSAAEQTADFGGATGTLTVDIAAMNRITGASAELTGSIP